MPVYDRRCDCGWKRADCYEPIVCAVPCPTCGAETAREWTSRAAIHGDDKFIGGLTLENLDHHPVTVYSRSELKREMDKRGLVSFVRHVGEPGSDKSSKTSRWV
jgi:hypothetical protein